MNEPPYMRMARDEQLVREAHPDAARVQAQWTPASGHDVTVLVWAYDGSAKSVVVKP